MAVLLILIAATLTNAQISTSGRQSPQVLASPTMELFRKSVDLPVEEMQALEQPIDPATYILGPGDLLAVSIRGGIDEVFQARVSPEGQLMIPLAPVLSLSGLTLVEARALIQEQWQSEFPSSEFDVVLIEMRTFRISVVGAVVQPGVYVVSPADRPSTAVILAGGFLSDNYYREVYSTEVKDAKLTYEQYIDRMKPAFASERRAKLIHLDESEEAVDLLRYMNSGDNAYNPNFQDGDRLVIGFGNILDLPLRISGAVNRPGRYEWIEGDKLSDLLEVAGGFLPGAQLDSLLVTRRLDNGSLETNQLDISSGDYESLPLEPGDLVMVRQNGPVEELATITIEGKVVYPGEYGIAVGQTRISDVIKLAGGFSPDAHLLSARILRKRESDDFRKAEAERVANMPDMNRKYVDVQFYFFQTRWKDYDPLAANFVSLFDEGISEEDFLLENGDVIVIPERTTSVLLMGHVKNPGMYPHVDGWNYKDYINHAGGFQPGASKAFVRWVSPAGSVWRTPDNGDEIQAGDMIFVPEKPNRTLFENVRDYMTLVSQLATILIVVITLK